MVSIGITRTEYNGRHDLVREKMMPYGRDGKTLTSRVRRHKARKLVEDELITVNEILDMLDETMAVQVESTDQPRLRAAQVWLKNGEFFYLPVY